MINALHSPFSLGLGRCGLSAMAATLEAAGLRDSDKDGLCRAETRL